MLKKVLQRTALLLTVLALLLPFGGSAAMQQPDIFTFLGPEYRAFADTFSTDFPVAVGYRADTMAGGCDSYLWDRDSIQAVFDALSAITVGGANDLIVTDSDYHFFFLRADGSTIRFSFNEHYLQTGGSRYALTGDDALWRIPFPCYSGSHTLFDVCMNDRVDDLVAHLDDAPPVRISFRQDDGPASEVDDADLIRQVVDAMRMTEVTWVDSIEYFTPENEVKREFVFTLEDGSTLPFTLYGDRIAVETGVSQLGTQYYLLDGLDALWALSFPGYENVRIDEGVTLDLLPLYGEEIEEAFSADRRDRLTTLTVTREADGAPETLTFSQEPYDAVSDLAYAITQMSYLTERADMPDGRDVVTFVFTDADGKTYSFLFSDGCAEIEDENGSMHYYLVEHGSIDENGIMDLVYEEQRLLSWKHDVNFQGKSDRPPSTATVLRTGLILLAVAAVIAGGVIGTVKLVKRKKAKKQAGSR